MAATDERLGVEQRELVAIAASIAVGCLPCTSYHFEASRKAGIDGARLRAAAAEAERVVADARERLAAHVHGEFDAGADTDREAPLLDSVLAALGAAIGANSLPNIRRALVRGLEAGLSEAELAQAIRVAEQVQRMAAAGHVQETERLIGVIAAAAAEGDEEICGSDCSCHSQKEADHVV